MLLKKYSKTKFVNPLNSSFVTKTTQHPFNKNNQFFHVPSSFQLFLCTLFPRNNWVELSDRGPASLPQGSKRVQGVCSTQPWGRVVLHEEHTRYALQETWVQSCVVTIRSDKWALETNETVNVGRVKLRFLRDLARCRCSFLQK